MEKTLSYNKSSNIVSIIVGSVTALCVSLVMILIFAVILRFVNIDSSYIMPINQVIKIVSIFIGTLVAMKKHKSKGLFKGLLIGLIYSLMAYLTFGLLSLTFSLSSTMLLDILFSSLIGAIAGIITVNL